VKCKTNKLTDKQEQFVQELVKGTTQRQAYLKVYPNSKKWKEKSVDEKACFLFNSVKVKARYREMKAKVIEKAEKKSIITVEEILQELKNVAMANGTDFAEIIELTGIRKIYDSEGNLTGEEPYVYKVVDVTPTKLLSKNKRSAIASIKQTKDGIEIKPHDKVKALELLGKHLGMFEKEDKDNTQTINVIHNIPRPPKDGDG